MDVSAPISLARLPRASRPDGIHFGAVHAMRNGLKKRRKEICAAVDGDSVGLYEIENGNILASFPVPPSSRALGPPYSIREKVDGLNIRWTYCAIKRENLRVEAFQTSGDDSARPTFFASPPLRNQDSPVTLLDVVQGSRGKQVLVVQQNGNITIFSGDLQIASSGALLSSQHDKGMRVLAVQHVTLAEAQRTILKQRPDMASAAGPVSSCLAVAYDESGQGGSVNSFRYGVWATDIDGGTSASSGKILHPLFEHDLSLAGNRTDVLNDKSCTFDSRASHLSVRAGHKFLSYDLTGLVPLLASTLHIGISGPHEILAISPAFAVCSHDEILQLYDLKYQSVQAQKDTKQANLKRKRDMRLNEGVGPIELVAYYPQSARIIGRRRHHLVAIDITAGGPGRLLETGNNLLHNIGRAISGPNLTAKSPEKQLLLEHDKPAVVLRSSVNWESLRHRLDQLTLSGDVAGFETVVADEIWKTHSVDELPEAGTSIPDFKVNYILSKIFQPVVGSDAADDERSATHKHVKIQFYSPKLISWISSQGLLSSRGVEKALESTASNAVKGLGAHTIAQALLDADPSCDLLVNCIENGFSPYVEEQAAVVQLLIQQALDSLSETAVAEAKSQANGTMDIDVVSDTAETHVQTLTATSTENPWLPMQGALIAALDRFGTAASSTISSNLKGLLSQREVLALIQFLRQQLFKAGHTRSLQSLPMTEEAPHTVRLDAMIKLLSACVDAMGPLGFFASLDNKDFVDTLIPELVTEVTNAKQSLEDVAELRGILREALRYQESVQRQRAAGADTRAHAASNGLQPRPGAIVTVYSEAVEGEENLQSGSMLPLSLKAQDVVTAGKIRKGGGQVKLRSIRQKRMLERRNKGEYSFERLVL
ncbi:hypothetical protein PV04_08987 [Phialophora macrospora]|uniref:Uncharacterized protein n=1 Tax=Phialophora macrospora TaxID=1851006 RepID=A0A0D2CFY2_9EURO|nr:hypothetical protein PV04_08987 [Phialophora macrospora]